MKADSQIAIWKKREQTGKKNNTLIFSLIMANRVLLLIFFHYHIPFPEDMDEIYVLEKYLFYESAVFILSLLEKKKNSRLSECLYNFLIFLRWCPS